jgi:YHS domain-containing protein
MFRTILYLIGAVLVISMLRSVIGIILKGLGELFHPSPGANAPPRPAVSPGGELKKDPVCGTFISTATAIQKRAGGETYYFCSDECLRRFEGRGN